MIIISRHDALLPANDPMEPEKKDRFLGFDHVPNTNPLGRGPSMWPEWAGVPRLRRVGSAMGFPDIGPCQAKPSMAEAAIASAQARARKSFLVLGA